MPRDMVMPYRRNLRQTHDLHRMIYKAHCWHFDAWLLSATDDRLYLYESHMAGGRALLGAHYRAIISDDRGGLRLGEPMEKPSGLKRRVSLQSSEVRGRYDALNTLHWREIVPLAYQPLPRGFVSRSVALHYIQVGNTPEPFDGATNYYRDAGKRSQTPSAYGLARLARLDSERVPFAPLDPLSLPSAE